MTALLEDPDPLLRTWEVARQFSVDVTTVRRWTKREGLPYLWLPTRQRRYRKSAVIAWYRERTAQLTRGTGTRQRARKKEAITNG